MSFLRRNHPPPEDVTDEENDDTIDPELRLRTVRTAASAIAESIRSEQRAQRRSSRRGKASRFFRKQEKKLEEVSTEAVLTKEIPGVRRNVYVNHPLSAIESDSNGEPLARYVRNKVRTTSKLCSLYIGSCSHHYFRIHSPHVSTQELVRAVPTVRIHVQPVLYTIHAVLTPRYRVANLFFLTIVILQSKCLL
jgi:phospholipid-translocating ATPase